MNNLIIQYHNVDVEEIRRLTNKDIEIINNIQNEILNMSALNITYNDELLNQAIIHANNFSKNKNHFMVFGTGGSNLGSKALINILQGKEKNKISFYDNIDPISFKYSIEKIDLKKTGCIIISKSGETPETLSQFVSLIQFFDQKNQLDFFFKNCLIITENKTSSLRDIANQYNCIILDHEIEIGGRFSVFSNVGMIPAVIAGIDVKKIHNGIKDILIKVKDRSFDEHLILAKFFTSNIYSKQIKNSVLMTYSDALFDFGKWYMQLWAESIGKNGKGITPIHAVGTTDQHSQLKLYLEGPKDKFFSFITTNHSKLGLKIHEKTLQTHKNSSYLAGKFMGDIMQAEQKATMDTFNQNGLAFREINLPKIDEFAIGQIMTLSILETVATCNFLGVNPFNQPAVEQGKILTRKYLS